MGSSGRAQFAGTASNLLDIAWGGGQFVTVGAFGTISVSSAPKSNDIVLNLPGSGVVVQFNDNSSASVLHGEPATAIATADVDNNGEDDVIVSFPAGTGPDANGGTYISRNQGALVSLDSKTAEHIAVGDVDGNGQQDLLLGFGSDGFLARSERCASLPVHRPSCICDRVGRH